MTSRGKALSLSLSLMLHFVLPSAICATSCSLLHVGKRRREDSSDCLISTLIFALDIVGFHIGVSLCSLVRPRQSDFPLPPSPVGFIQDCSGSNQEIPKGMERVVCIKSIEYSAEGFAVQRMHDFIDSCFCNWPSSKQLHS